MLSIYLFLSWLWMKIQEFYFFLGCKGEAQSGDLLVGRGHGCQLSHRLIGNCCGTLNCTLKTIRHTYLIWIDVLSCAILLDISYILGNPKDKLVSKLHCSTNATFVALDINGGFNLYLSDASKEWHVFLLIYVIMKCSLFILVLHWYQDFVRGDWLY